jgi:PST family polysaccharide transporter
MSDKAKSYRNTALIAISSVINILFSVIKNKFLAVWLGPAGLGKFSILNDFISFVSSMTSMGVSNSGVQAISQASTQSNSKVRTVYNSLIRFFTIISVIVTIAIIVFAKQISTLLVHNDSLIWFLRVAAIVVVIKIRSQVQSALITGMQRVGLLAKANIYNGIIVTIVSIALVWILRDESIPYLVITIALVSWAISYTQTRKVLAELPNTKNRISKADIKPILLLGVATLWASLLENVVNLVAKSSITKQFQEDHLGYYQVAIGITFQYIGFITSSITSDYYPRLVATVSKGSDEVAKFVNQQIGISISLIMPLLLTMLTFSKLFITLLFSKKFLPSNDLISYSVAGTLLLVVCWPIAYVFLAHRATKTYLLSEFVGNSSHLILILIAIGLNNFPFLGLAYVLHYIIYLLLIVYLFYINFDGYITKDNIKLFIINLLLVGLIIIGKKLLPETISYIIGSVLILVYLYLSRKEYIYMFNSIVKKR